MRVVRQLIEYFHLHGGLTHSQIEHLQTQGFFYTAVDADEYNDYTDKDYEYAEEPADAIEQIEQYAERLHPDPKRRRSRRGKHPGSMGLFKI